MRLQFILRKFLIPVVLSVPILFWGPVATMNHAHMVRLLGNNFFLLSSLGFLELVILLIGWELSVPKLIQKLDGYVTASGHNAVRQGDARKAMLAIRIERGLYRVSRLLTLGWSFRYYETRCDVCKGLTCWSLNEGIKRVCRLLFSVPAFLSIVSTCLILWSNDPGFAGRIDGVLSSFKDNLWWNGPDNALLWLSTMFAIMPAVSVLIYVYLHSQKREVRRIIDGEMLSRRKEVVLLFRKLLLLFDRNIYDICVNFDYVINNYSIYVRDQLDCAKNDCGSGCNDCYELPGRSGGYMFAELNSLSEMSDIVSRLSSDELEGFTRAFAWRDEAVWNLYVEGFLWLSPVGSVEARFFTKSAMKKRIANSREFLRRVSNRALERYLVNIEESLVADIYSGLRLVYLIERSRSGLRRYLYATPAERLMQKVVNRDK